MNIGPETIILRAQITKSLAVIGVTNFFLSDAIVSRLDFYNLLSEFGVEYKEDKLI